MAEAARMFSLRRLERADNVERQELLTSLAHTRALIQQAYRGFNSAEDGDLIESYVFEINALQSRYNYLLRRSRSWRPSHEPAPWPGPGRGQLWWALAALLLLPPPAGRLLGWRCAPLWGCSAALLNQIGLGLGVNLVNALILGVLGVPGLGLLLMLQWVLRT